MCSTVNATSLTPGGVSAFSGIQGTIFPWQAPCVFVIHAASIVADFFGIGVPFPTQ